MSTILKNKSAMLFTMMTAFFVANALIAECIGVKIFSLEATLGLPVHPFSLFGEHGLSYALTCGVLLWPLEFVITDLVNEYYGPKMVRRISTIAIVLISYAFIMFTIASKTIAPNWWLSDKVDKGIPNYQDAFAGIFGQSSWIIIGSLVAFGVSQIIDAMVFHKIKAKTGEGKLWLRATGSTIISQLIDSYIVLFIAFQIGNGWSTQKVLAICIVNYSYKVLMALLLTPVISIVHRRIDKYFGQELSTQMKAEAMQ
jgi:queuosine precursor transporter